VVALRRACNKITTDSIFVCDSRTLLSAHERVVYGCIHVPCQTNREGRMTRRDKRFIILCEELKTNKQTDVRRRISARPIARSVNGVQHLSRSVFTGKVQNITRYFQRQTRRTNGKNRDPRGFVCRTVSPSSPRAIYCPTRSYCASRPATNRYYNNRLLFGSDCKTVTMNHVRRWE